MFVSDKQKLRAQPLTNDKNYCEVEESADQLRFHTLKKYDNVTCNFLNSKYPLLSKQFNSKQNPSFWISFKFIKILIVHNFGLN
jgi:hypothetical protein